MALPLPLANTPMLQTFLRQSDQAAQAKSYTISGHSPDDVFDMSIFNEEDWALVEAAVGRVRISDLERANWLSDIRGGVREALMALELTLLPSLESLDFQDVRYDISETNKWLGKVMEKAAESQLGTDENAFLLPKLQNVSLTYWDTENGMNIENLVVFMSLPSVQHLNAFMVDSESWEASPGMSFSLKVLSLDLACIDAEALGNLMQCCPRLEKFSYIHGGSIVGYSILIPSKLSPAFATLKPCLQELEIVDEDDPWEEDELDEDEIDRVAPMASFADFEKLHTLALRACMLVGWDENGEDSEDMSQRTPKLVDMVPKSLERLHLDSENMSQRTSNLVDMVPKSLKRLYLDHCPPRILVQLKELLVRMEERTPLLELIHLAMKENYRTDKEEAQRLANAFLEKNVRLNIQTCCETRNCSHSREFCGPAVSEAQNCNQRLGFKDWDPMLE